MANVAKINGYDVKDADARGDIAYIQQDLSTAQGNITTLQGDVSDIKADLGDITALDTTVKTSAVNAINEVNGKAEDNADNIGTLSNLTTTAKTDLVSAVNEVDSHADTNTTNIGNLAALNTVDKSDIVSAINEVERNASYGISKNTYNFAPTFSDETSYAVGDYVTYNGVLYRCTTAHTAGVWVAGHFIQVTVGGDIARLPEFKNLATGNIDELRSFAINKLYSVKVSVAFNVMDDDENTYQIPAFAEAIFYKHAGDLTVQFHSYYGTPGIWEIFYNSNGQTRGKKIV